MAFHDTQNTTGQIRRKPIRDAILALVSRDTADIMGDKPKTVAQQIAYDLVTSALMGQDRDSARKELIDRVEGKPPQAIVGDDDFPDVIKPLSGSDRELLDRYIQQRGTK